MRTVPSAFSLIAALALFLFPLACSQQGAGTPGAGREGEGGEIVRFGLGAMLTPEQGKRYYLELIDWLSAKTGYELRLVPAADYADVNAKLEKGEIDISFVCSGPYVSGREKYGLELLAQPQAYGKSVYHSYLIVPADSSAKTLADLQGKSFGFTDPESNTGCLVPTYMLAREGKRPSTFFGKTVFTGSHDGSIAGVAYRFIDGAAVDSLIWEHSRSIDPTITNRTRVILVSPGYANPPVVARPGVDPAVKKAVRKALLSMHEDREGKRILAGMKIDRFVEGEDKAYDSIREMRSWIEGQERQEKK